MKGIILLLSIGLLATWVVGAAQYQELIELRQAHTDQALYVEQLCQTVAQQGQTITESDAVITEKTQVIQLMRGKLNEMAAENIKSQNIIIAHEADIKDLAGQIAMLKKYGGLTEFRSRQHLQSWLAENGVSEREYIKHAYDCEDFAIDLVLEAAADHYIVGLLLKESRRGGHIKCFTPIGNSVYQIEPQSDGTKKWGLLDYRG